MMRRGTLAFLFFFILVFEILLVSCSQNSYTSRPPSSLQSKVSTVSSKNEAHITRVLVGVFLGCLTGLFASVIFLLVVVRLILLFGNRTPILKGPISFSSQIPSKSLQFAIANQSENAQLLLLPSNPNGSYFRLTLDNELVVAVKRLELNTPNASPSQNSNSGKKRRRWVQRELEMLARVKHRNVMSLRAYLRDEGKKLFLVYDYIASGSLEDAMKKVRLGELSLGWEVRHRIAVGIVKGLRYLHFECSPSILHQRLKPGNVMLDEGYEPRLGDSGLGMMVSPVTDSFFCDCYVAPECFQSCRYTDKCDVFSFGVILGILLTGRDPLDPFFNSEATTTGRGGIGRWLRHLQQSGEAREALDKTILGEEEQVEEEEMLMAVRIALVCLSDLPADRPSCDELVVMLTQLHSF